MRTFLLLLPAGLSTLVLAAHFMRRGSLLATLLCFALLSLLWRRRPWARRVLQGALVLGALEWIWTLLNFASARQTEGEPWLRMAIILGAVAVVALLGAALLETAAMRKRFEGGPN
jgi:hypothetical protein